MNSEHVEVLERLRDRWATPGECAALDAAIASLSAQQPAACDMGALCIGCEPRNADGSCPDQQPAAVDGPYRTVDGVVTVNGIALDEAVKLGDRYAATIEKRGMPRAAQVFEALVMIGRHALAGQQGGAE